MERNWLLPFMCEFLYTTRCSLLAAIKISNIKIIVFRFFSTCSHSCEGVTVHTYNALVLVAPNNRTHACSAHWAIRGPVRYHYLRNAFRLNVCFAALAPFRRRHRARKRRRSAWRTLYFSGEKRNYYWKRCVLGAIWLDEISIALTHTHARTHWVGRRAVAAVLWPGDGSLFLFITEQRHRSYKRVR